MRRHTNRSGQASKTPFQWRLGLRMVNADAAGTIERPRWEMVWIWSGPDGDEPSAPTTSRAGPKPRPGSPGDRLAHDARRGPHAGLLHPHVSSCNGKEV